MFVYSHRNRKEALKTYLYAGCISMCRNRTKFKTTVCISFKKTLTWNLEVCSLLCKMDICMFWKESCLICHEVMNRFEVIFQY